MLNEAAKDVDKQLDMSLPVAALEMGPNTDDGYGRKASIRR